jgi:hypothetical protein
MSDDVRSMYDKEYLYHYDLEGRDVTVCIERITQGTLTGKGNKKAKKPIVYFRGKQKGLALCITNAKTIKEMYGSFRAADWIGKWITLYPTTTTFGSDTVECIRVRPQIPKRVKAQTQDEPAAEPSHDDDGVVNEQPVSDTNGDAT